MVQGKRKSAAASSRPPKRGKSGKSGKGGGTGRGKGKGGSSQPRTWKQRLKRAGLWSLIVGLVLALIGVLTFTIAYKTIDIPEPNDEFLTQTTKVYYADGKKQLGQFAIQKRDSIDFDEMPQTIKDAVVAAENRTFWTDSGIDPKGILRAAFSNAKGGATQGASTITQQYVKILYLTQERTISRKAKEAILSLKIKNQLSKEEILEGYLNTIYFGRGAYGIQAAAQAYFGIPAKQLTLAQSAVLATILNNPSLYDPDGGPEDLARLQSRYARILDAMVKMDTAKAVDVASIRDNLPKFPKIRVDAQYGGQRGHMLTMVRKELSRLGFSDQEIDGGGLRVTTTFTKKAMDAARRGVAEERPEGFGKDLHVGVASVEPGTGAVRGFYGGHDFLDSQINWAVAGGQAGSTFKPFAVAAGIEAGYELKDTFDGNSPYVIPDTTFDFENQGDRDYGRVSLLKATEDSINSAFIDMTYSMPDGPERIIDVANAMGIPPATEAANPYGFPTSSPGLEPNIGVSLGSQTVSPINMANGYATIANRGIAADAFIIEKVVNDRGDTVYNHKVTTHQAISEGIADDTGWALQQVVRVGSGTPARALGRPAGGKTGTATNGRDEVSSAWFVGYTPQLATAVMYVRGQGNEQLKDWLPSYFGGAYPARTWTAVMGYALDGEEVLDLPVAANVEGEAPDSGHEPAPPPPPPPPPKKPKDKKTTADPTTDAPPPPPATTQAPPPPPPPPPTTPPPSNPVPDPSTPPPPPTTTPPAAGPGGGGGRTGAGAAGRRTAA